MYQNLEIGDWIDVRFGTLFYLGQITAIKDKKVFDNEKENKDKGKGQDKNKNKNEISSMKVKVHLKLPDYVEFERDWWIDINNYKQMQIISPKLGSHIESLTSFCDCQNGCKFVEFHRDENSIEEFQPYHCYTLPKCVTNRHLLSGGLNVLYSKSHKKSYHFRSQ